MAPYRGRISGIEKKKNIIIFAVSVLLIIIGISLGVFSNKWIWTILFLILCITAYFTASYFIKTKQHADLRLSHFLLAVFCRAENNRLYLKQGVELRPGYLGKWIEFEIMDLEETGDPVSYIR